MFLLTLAACVAVCVANVPPRFHGDEAWAEYKQRFGKIYTSQSEEQMRFLIWRREVSEIDVHNAVYGHQYEQGINGLSDMTDDEYEQYSSGLSPDYESHTSSDAVQRVPLNVDLPDAVDWLKEGYVTEVKNQGRCGSCYSFAATGALEAAWKKKTGRLVSISEQQIVDCAVGKRYHNKGCHGGWYQFAWKYLKENGGANSEKGYPYTAKQGECHANPDDVVAKVAGYSSVRHNEEALKEAIANVGPVAVGIDASHPGFRRYKSGVHYDANCNPKRLIHAVLCVGYGSENGQDYWLVKNSWGAHWGMSGFIKMARNKNNNCGIATNPAYPIV